MLPVSKKEQLQSQRQTKPILKPVYRQQYYTQKNGGRILPPQHVWLNQYIVILYILDPGVKTKLRKI